ncbi:hypothetical protein [Xanthomonas vasicola]|uniref:hypothetical protein n=1 Tax=Xanthomonas vasicola TaxID=56459 RepID=UPI000F8E4AE8|nr:hypothetical protein [Xanthomonas vasicola]
MNKTISKSTLLESRYFKHHFRRGMRFYGVRFNPWVRSRDGRLTVIVVQHNAGGSVRPNRSQGVAQG